MVLWKSLVGNGMPKDTNCLFMVHRFTHVFLPSLKIQQTNGLMMFDVDVWHPDPVDPILFQESNACGGQGWKPADGPIFTQTLVFTGHHRGRARARHDGFYR